MAEFKSGTREEVESGAAQYTNTATFISEGSPAPIVMEKTSSQVGYGTKTTTSRRRVDGKLVVTSRTVTDKSKPGPRIYHRSVIYPVKDSSGRVTGSKRVVYIEKNGTYQPAAVSTDGGKTYQFSDDQFPTMDGVAGTALQNDLNSKTDSAIRKEIDRSVVSRVKGDQSITVEDRATIADRTKNTVESSEPEISGDSNAGDSGDNNAGETKFEKILEVDIQQHKGTRDAFPGIGGAGALSYPSTLRNSKQDKIQFNMIKYKPSGFAEGTFGSNPRGSGRELNGEFKDKEIIGRVFLPIPAGITDTTGATWGNGEMTPLQIALAQIGLGGVKGGVGGLLDKTQDAVNKIGEMGDDVKTALTNSIVGDAVGVQGLLTRTTGAILNPNLELLFSKPTLRPFNFTFKLSARSEEEANEIIKIIRFFKQGMAPIRSESNLFIKAPHTFRIRYLHEDKDHPFLNQFKECALKNLTVNYTPEGNYATFRDGKMVSYQLTMSFQELEPVFNDDYPNDNDTSLGF